MSCKECLHYKACVAQFCFSQGWSEESFEEPQFPCENFGKIQHCVSGENLKGLMLWKDDFKHQRDWVAICKALDLPETTTTIELGCVVRVHKY